MQSLFYPVNTNPSERRTSIKSFGNQPPMVINVAEGRVAVEAATSFGWSKWLGPNGAFVGMQGFGASAPEQHLYKHFGITAEAVAAAARELVGKR